MDTIPSLKTSPSARARWAGPSVALAGVALIGGLAVVRPLAAVALTALASLIGMAIVIGRTRFRQLLWVLTAIAATANGLRLGPVALSDVLLVAATGASFGGRWRRDLLPNRAIVGAATLLTGAVIGTLAGSGARADGLLRFALAAGMSLLAVCLWDPTARELRQVMWAWVIGAAGNAVIGLVSVGVASGRAQGLSSHPNHLGLACAMAVGLALGVGTSEERPLWRLLTWPVVAVLSVAVADSGSRAALLALVVTIGAFLLIANRRRLWDRFLAVAALGGLSLAAGLVRLPSEGATARALGSISAGESDADRLESLGSTIERIARSPLTGGGFEFALEAHNVYLQMLVIGGPLALVGLLAVVLGVTVRGLRSVRVLTVARRLLITGPLAGYLGYLVAALFQNILWDRYVWLLIGVMLVAARPLRDEIDEARTGPLPGSAIEASSP